MPFTFGTQNRVKWPVVVHDRDEDGKPVEKQFFAIFELPPRSEIKQREREINASVAKKMNGLYSDGKKRTPEEIDETFKQIHEQEDAQEAEVFSHTVDWEGVEDPGGQPVEFTREKLEALCERNTVYKALTKAYNDAKRGAVEKN